MFILFDKTEINDVLDEVYHDIIVMFKFLNKYSINILFIHNPFLHSYNQL